MFEKAIREKVRFSTTKGNATCEDLYDLTIETLDFMFKNLNKQVKTSEEESLLTTKNKVDEILELKIEIIKHVVSVKLEENKANRKAINKSNERQKLVEALADREGEDLKGLSTKEIKKAIKALDND